MLWMPVRAYETMLEAWLISMPTSYISYITTVYRRAPFFEGYKFRELCRKGSLWKLFSRMTLVVSATTLYNTRELAHATRLATLEDIIADKLAKERFRSNICNELSDCLVSQQCQLRAARLSDRACSWSITWLGETSYSCYRGWL